MKIPYTELELRVALISAVSKVEERETELREALEIIHSKEKNINHETAKFNGISVPELINSPNMEYMIDAYKESCIMKAIEALEGFGLSKKEAWAVIWEITK
jgi:hypothetical protein